MFQSRVYSTAIELFQVLGRQEDGEQLMLAITLSGVAKPTKNTLVPTSSQVMLSGSC